ncbi:MAG: helix-turn-helix domain-containing protein [Thermoplasmata archaeon]
MRVAPPLTLAPEERQRLESWARGRSTPHRLVLRAQIVLRAAEGAQNKQIAEEWGTHRSTCALWRNRCHRLRLAGIEQDAPRPGGPLRLPDATIRAIVHDPRHPPPASATHWSTRSMDGVHGPGRAPLALDARERVGAAEPRGAGAERHRRERDEPCRDPRTRHRGAGAVGDTVPPGDRGGRGAGRGGGVSE